MLHLYLEQQDLVHSLLHRRRNERIATVPGYSCPEYADRVRKPLRANREPFDSPFVDMQSALEIDSSWLVLPVSCYAAWRNSQLCHLNLWPMERWVFHLERVGLEVEEVHPYLRHELVAMWDALELLQQVWVFHRRLVSIVWQRIPPSLLERMACWASQLDLSAPAPGGGRLVVARKR